MRQNVILTLPTLPAVANNSIPTHSDHVEIPRSAFNPCDTLKRQLDPVDVFQICPRDDFGLHVFL